MIALKALKQTKEIKKYEKSTKTESCVEQNLFCIFCRFFFYLALFNSVSTLALCFTVKFHLPAAFIRI
jgi:hypothetical protein